MTVLSRAKLMNLMLSTDRRWRCVCDAKSDGQFSSEAKGMKTSQREGFYHFHIEPKKVLQYYHILLFAIPNGVAQTCLGYAMWFDKS